MSYLGWAVVAVLAVMGVFVFLNTDIACSSFLHICVAHVG